MADNVYLNAVRECLDKGTRKENRTGVDTISTFNVNYEIDLQDGFPLLTTKKINWKNIVVELLWFLSGEESIDLLKKHGCNFWDDWAVGRKVPSAYGNFWRHFPVHRTIDSEDIRIDGDDTIGYNDQLAWIESELKRNPMSRRLVCSAWAPGNAQTSKLPPCHCMFIFNVQNLVSKQYKSVTPRYTTRGEIMDYETGRTHTEYEQFLCCHLTQRSCDLALGVPYNIASYALLTELFARFAGLQAGIFGHTLVDAHIYTSKPDGSMPDRPDGTPYSKKADHVPGLEKQLVRRPKAPPKLQIHESIKSLKDIKQLLEADTDTVMDHFKLEGYDPHPFIKFKPAV